jgi:nitroreductase
MRSTLFASFARVDVEEAIRTRRTHKVYGAEPVSRETLDELFELARWAPNHNLTNPWRFRVVGPQSLRRLKEAAGEEAAAKLDRAPTLVVASAALSGDPVEDEEDLHATACAVYAVLLGATARGLASYWRTPAALREEAGRRALGLPADERFVALIHLGERVADPPLKERDVLESRAAFLP